MSDFLDRIRTRAEQRRLGTYLGRHLGKVQCLAQHDQNVANDTGAAVRSDINNALAALFSLSSGATEPSVKVAYQLWADTTSNTLKQRNAANTGWIVRRSLAETFVLSRIADSVFTPADIGRTIIGTGTYTQTFNAAATLADGWFVQYKNNGSGTITLDPNGAETIDGAATLALLAGESCIIFCNGTAFFTIGRLPANPTITGTITLGGALAATGNVTVSRAQVGGDTIIATGNTDNTNAGSHAKVKVEVAGASGGDPTIYYHVPGVVIVQVGIDNSDGDAFKIENTGAADLGSGTTWVRISSSGGVEHIRFNATQNPSADASTLDDYEEGTWSPSVGGTATYNAQTGVYTKIGRVVHVHVLLSINLIGTGSTTVVTGLPFTCANDGGPLPVAEWTGSATAVIYMVGRIPGSGTSITIFSAAAATANLGTNAVFANSSAIRMGGIYNV